VNLHFKESIGRTAKWIAVFALIVCSIPRLYSENILWTYDFTTGEMSDWNHYSNSPSAGFTPAGEGLFALYNGGNTVFHSAAINETKFKTKTGDRIQMRLAWTPLETRNANAGSNNQVFQLGLMNLDTSWEKSEETFNTADGFWLAGREVVSTAPGDDTWGTETLDLFLHSDETPSLINGAYLGRITFDSYTSTEKTDSAPASASATYLDIALDLESTDEGNFNYAVEIGSYEWNRIGDGEPTFTPEGTLFERKGTRAHGLDGFDGLHPALGYLVADSSQQGVAASFFGSSISQSPIPEPSGLALLFIGGGLLGLRRRS